ncbi:MAG: DUF5058 family protein [Anaerotruncus sp.]|nr:DUF5058 family protein [Anaerotruncus sp.]
MLEDILKVANSWPIWAAAFALVSIVIIQSVLYIRLAFKNAPLVGVTKEQCKESVRCGMIISIGPTIAIFIVVVSMMVVVGAPITWMRLSMIGSASTELTACTLGAEAYGVELGGAGYNLTAMATAWWAMSVNGAGWLLIAAFLTPHLETVRLRMGGGDAKWLGLITSAAMLGLYSYLLSPYVVKVGKQAFAALVGFVIMYILLKVAKNRKWLKEWALGFAILGGTVAGILLR